MSIASDHNEWLSLIEVSGPFLSMPVLLRTFPQGLDALDKAQLAELRLAYAEWLDNQNSLRPSTAIHSVWVRYILEHILGFEKANILEGQAIPGHLKAYIAEHGETLRPDLVITGREDTTQKPRLMLQIVSSGQKLERVEQDKRWKATPAMRMMELLRESGVPLGLVTNGEQWMLVHAPRNETSSYISWYTWSWLEEPLTLRAFCSLLGANRFFSVSDEDTLEGMLIASANDQQEVTDQLGYQVRQAVEVLIRAVDKADQDRGRALLNGITESDLYEAALTVMMRLVFLLSAEERGLLLLGEPLYDQNYAVSTLRAQLRETADEEVLERRFDAWCRLLATFRAVFEGIHHDRLNLPAYGGSLFDPERFPFLEGRTAGKNEQAEPLLISNRTVLHLLEALQMLRVKVPGGGPAEARRLSFRALDVEQIGHVYEGLLDHIAVRATQPVLGLAGTRDKEPEVPLSVLKHEEAKGEKNFLQYLREITGRSENTLRKALQSQPDGFESQRLHIACNNDPLIYTQLAAFSGLIRTDDFGYPAVFMSGSVYITAGATRRATGTHYTPRSLTEPIVQHTLEPLVYTGPAEGLPKENWKLKSPADLLELKICDMAMGSAGFLVQVIRYMSIRLVETWEETCQGNRLQITPEGKPATGKPGELIIPKDDEERLVLARRLVADRCVYGVDKNPLAVEIAKLSIWLTTLDKGRPFTFLDHALKCGDALVGESEDDFLRWAKGYKDSARTLFDVELQNQLDLACQKRRELESLEVRDIRDADRKAHILKEAEYALEHIKRGCDLLTGAHLQGLTPNEVEELQLRFLFPYMAGELDGVIDMQKHRDARHSLQLAIDDKAFHWSFTFPEVFERGGFNAFVGNPPFLGGLRISTLFGNEYFRYLRTKYPNSNGTADLCAFFFLRAFHLLNKLGKFGLISTNTIAQGDTRETGLDAIGREGGEIYNAMSSFHWPGDAAVYVSIVHITKSMYQGKKYLNKTPVLSISSQLDNGLILGRPYTLWANAGKSFIGEYVLGMGFILSPEEAQILISLDPKNEEVIFPYLNGSDLNTQPDLQPTRYAINFFDWDLDKASAYTRCISRIRELVYPQRMSQKDKFGRDHWWRYMRSRPDMHETIKPLDQVLCVARVSKTVAFVFMQKNMIFNEKVVVFAFQEIKYFSVLQSTIHNIWAWKYSSTLKSDLNYAPTDCFENYPFPEDFDALEQIGEIYHKYRQDMMITKQEGLTTIYNRFHNSKEKSNALVHLRELHIELDKAVSLAYGWNDLDLGHGFHETLQGIRFTISEAARQQVLARLLRLNHERHEEEIRQGLHNKKVKENSEKSEKSRAVKEDPAQYGLF